MTTDLYYEVPLVSNGMVEGYPKSVYMRTIRVKHIRDLIFAAEQTNEVYGRVLTSVLDSLINFEKTGFIKSSDELSMIDRQKLIIWQRVNSKGQEYVIPYKCPKCGEETENTFKIKDMIESKLKNNITTENIKYFVNDDVNDFSYGNYYDLILGFPTRKDYLRIQEYINDYKKEVFGKIDSLLFISEIKNLEEMKNRIKLDDNKLVFERIKQKVENKKQISEKTADSDIVGDTEIQDMKKESTKETLDIENKIKDNKEKRIKNKEEIEKILKTYDLQLDFDEEIESFEDLYFDNFFNYLLMLGCCIKTEIQDYVKFVMNLSYVMIGDIEKYMKKCAHSISNKVIYRCSNCRYKSDKEELQFTADFFLR